jgi:hypothetical protein
MLSEDLKALRSCTAAPKDLRAAIQNIRIAPEYIEATNGQMLLRVGRTMAATDAPSGVYHIIGVNKIGGGISEAILDKIEIEFPDTERITPKTAGAARVSIPLLDDALSITRAVINLHTFTGEAYSLALLERIAPLNNTWQAYRPVEAATWTSKALRLDCIAANNTAYTAVMMPFKLIEK